MRAKATFRIRLITALVVLFAVCLIGRLYVIQVVHSEQYEQQATEQYVHTVQNTFNRGSIYFTTKDGEQVSAASIRTGFVLALNPTRIRDAKAAYNRLEQYIDIDEERFIYRATLPDRTYVAIDDRVSEDEADRIADFDLPGVMLYQSQWRYYPGKSLAAPVIGFTGFGAEPETAERGRYGLERYYDELLQRDDETLAVNFFAELFTNLGATVSDAAPAEAEAGDLVTTIEPTVTRMLDDVLQSTHDAYGAEHTGGIIMDPQTGAIYAMSSRPGYNNNDRQGVSIEQFRNPLVQDVREFGSIVKPLTVAAGIDSNAITPTSQYNDRGVVTIDGARISNYDGRARGRVDMQTVLNQSLNTGVAHVVDQMGTQTFSDYFADLGIGSKTGIDLPNEEAGLVQNLSSPRQVEYATASFGQGFAITPIAMTRALAALGNGGELVTPHIVSAVQYRDGRREERVDIAERTTVFSPKTSETISRMLTNTVDEALRGGDVALPNYSIAAKTGTAQMVNPRTGEYEEDQYLHSFFGYFPAYDPQFIILLYTVDPRGSEYASQTLTDPFMEITNFLINYYQVPPDR